MTKETTASLTFARIDAAYWVWHAANCPFERKVHRMKELEWRRSHSFPYQGKFWARHASGTNLVTGNIGQRIKFTAGDGTVIANN